MTKAKTSKREQATEIVQLFREGQTNDALELFEDYGFRKEFLGFAIKMGIGYADADDILQKFIIEKLWEKSHSIKNVKFARTWMYKTFINMLNDHGRMLKKNREVPIDRQVDVSKEITVYEDQSLTREDCVREQYLKFKQAESAERSQVIDLILEGFSTEEIRLIIGRTYGATREFMSQCRKKIKSYLDVCNEIKE